MEWRFREPRAAKTDTPCEKKPRLLPFSSSFAAEERTPAGAGPYILYWERAGFRQWNGDGDDSPAAQLLAGPAGPLY